MPVVVQAVWTLCAWPGGTSDTSTLSILSIARAASCQTSWDICLPPCEKKIFSLGGKPLTKNQGQQEWQPHDILRPWDVLSILDVDVFFGVRPPTCKSLKHSPFGLL